MSAPAKILKLVERFNLHRDDYTSPKYNETQLRREFVDPFFKALSWDADNVQDYAEAYQDVVHEDSIKVGKDTKAPDYSFRLGGVRKFFVETKKPSLNLKQDTSPAFQLRRYAWSAKLPLSILTDFEEFVVYDCRVRPAKTDKPATARILYIRYDEYEERWDEIASLFGKEQVYKGAFDRFAESKKKKKGTAEVDDAFLDEIELWRNELAKSLALRNPELSQREMNFAVQRTIDRIIFCGSAKTGASSSTDDCGGWSMGRTFIRGCANCFGMRTTATNRVCSISTRRQYALNRPMSGRSI